MAADFHIKGDTTLDGGGLKNGLSSLTVAAGNMISDLVKTVANGFQQAIQTGINFNAQMETYMTNFTTMLGGNAAAADQLVEELQELGSSTPLAITDLTNAAQTLLNFGAADAESMADTLRMIGDVALGDASKMQSLSLAYGQMVSTGKLQGSDLLQMINAGFNPLQELSKMGYGTVAELKEQMSKGAISVEMVQEAFRHATEEGGQFYNAMDAASQTFTGQLSTLEDNATALAGALTEGLTEGLSDLIPQANDIVVQLTDSLNENGISGMLDVAQNMLGQFIDTVIEKAPEVLDTGTRMIVSFIDDLAAPEKLNTMLDTAGKLISTLLSGIVRNIPDLLAAAVRLVTNFVSYIIRHLPQILAVGGKLVGELVSGIIQSVFNIGSAALRLIGEFKRAWSENGGWKGLGSDLIGGIISGITGSVGKIAEAAKNAASKALKAAKDFLGIKSPSRRGKEEIGKPFDEGIAEGVDDSATLMVQAAQSGAEKMISAAQNEVLNNQLKVGANITATGTAAQTVLNATFRGEHVSVIELDGREVGRSLTPYIDEQLDL